MINLLSLIVSLYKKKISNNQYSNKKKTIAIIGGGVTGVGLLKSLHDLKYNVYMFDKNNKVGGIWTSNKFYNLKIQVNSKHYRFYDKPHKQNIHNMSGEKIQNYIQEYIDENNLNKFIFLNFEVKVIQGEKKHRIKNKNNGNICDILFDYVIFTGTNSRNVPDLFKSPEIQNKILYPDILTKSLLNKLNNKKVVIYGGSKSAMDVAYSLKKETSANVILVSRGFHSFARSCEKNSILIKDIINAGVVGIFNKYKISNKTFLESLFKLNINSNLEHFKIGQGDVLTKDEFNLIKKVNKKKNTIIYISKNEIIFDNQEKINYDYIFLCLGYKKIKNLFTSKTIFSSKEILISTFPIKPHITSFFIDKYIKSNHDNFEIFFNKFSQQKSINIYIKIYILFCVLLDIKMPSIENFIKYCEIINLKRLNKIINLKQLNKKMMITHTI